MPAGSRRYQCSAAGVGLPRQVGRVVVVAVSAEEAIGGWLFDDFGVHVRPVGQGAIAQLFGVRRFPMTVTVNDVGATSVPRIDRRSRATGVTGSTVGSSRQPRWVQSPAVVTELGKSFPVIGILHPL